MSRFALHTARLTLTPLGTQYLDTVNAYAMDAENTKYMIHLPNGSADETLAFLRSVEAEWDLEQPTSYEFAILYRGRHIGAASIYLENGVGELGWIVQRAYWRNGFATEAAQAIVDHFAAHFDVRHFIAHCDAENTASYRIMEKLGMRKTAEYGGRKNRSASAESTEYQYELLLDGKE